MASVTSGWNIGKVQQMNAQLALAEPVVSQVVANASMAPFFVWGSTVSGEMNNNGSLVATSSQNDISAVSVLNAAASAVNLGQNIARAEARGWVDLDQLNLQAATMGLAPGLIASDGAGVAQTVSNSGIDWVTGQTSNNASVQINGSGSQTGMKVLSLANAVYSAVNVGQNVAAVSGNRGLDASQVNAQCAAASVNAGQGVSNVTLDGVIWRSGVSDQTNNNGSVQIVDSQNRTTGLSILSAAASAVNVGQNVMSASSGGRRTDLRQYNGQGIGRHVSAYQE